MKNTPLFCILVSLFFLASCSNSASTTDNESAQESEEYQMPAVDTTNGIFAIIHTTKGVAIARLFEEKAPLTVANFVALAEGSMPNSYRQAGAPYYDSLKFHRVISYTNGDKENFMIQGGDPQGTGNGGPGYQFKDEFSDIKLDRPGLLAMANSGPSTNGSQFFITLKATPWLDGLHTIFGELISGTEVPFLIKTNDYMTKIKIIRKGDKALKYNAMAEYSAHK